MSTGQETAEARFSVALTGPQLARTPFEVGIQESSRFFLVAGERCASCRAWNVLDVYVLKRWRSAGNSFAYVPGLEGFVFQLWYAHFKVPDNEAPTI